MTSHKYPPFISHIHLFWCGISCVSRVFAVYFLVIKDPVSIIAVASAKVTNRTMNHAYHLLRCDSLYASAVLMTSTYE
jgi:hypothetical protein